MVWKIFSKKSKKKKKVISYEEAKALAVDGDEKSRADLAGRNDVPKEVLYYLADDPSPNVRESIALNTAAPEHADLLLAKDKNENVRSSLAEKIARLSPGLTADEQNRLRRMTYDALSILAKDQATRVRQILSEALRDVANAPPDVIRRLAWDVEAAVATPVLRFSPILTDEDLIEIIRAKPSEGCTQTVSQRENVSNAVSNAIVDSSDTDAIALLLGNDSAQIREETLSKVIDQADQINLWHMPLAMRPRLPTSAAVKIARFVADDILKRMAARKDLSPKAYAAVRDVVHKRLGDGEAVMPDAMGSSDGVQSGMSVDDDTEFDRAAKMWADGKLDEAEVINTINDGQKKLAMAMIAVMSDLSLRIVERTCDAKNAKGCLAISWRASLSANTAEIVQEQLAGISAGKVLYANNGEYPVPEKDLVWQIDFVRRL